MGGLFGGLIMESAVVVNLSNKDYNKTVRAFYFKGLLHGALSGWVVAILTMGIGFAI